MLETAFSEQILGTGGTVTASKAIEPLELLATGVRWSEPPAAEAYWGQLGMYDTPRYVVAPTRGATSHMYRALVAWSGELVPEREADHYERAAVDRQRLLADIAASAWERANVGRSSMRSAVRHPAFAGLMDLDQASIAVALQRLHGRQRPLWLFFLNRAVDDRPAEGAETITEAAEAWRQWGRRHGYLP